jgi:predicted O-methyltransferase YrrM
VSLRLPHVARRLVAELVIADRERRGSDFSDVPTWSDRIRGFDDLAFLFSSTIVAHGIASLRFDEGAYLYRLALQSAPRTAVEIGRFRGGSTFLVAAALEHGVLHSYDLATRQGRDGQALDRQLLEALERHGLAERVRLHVADSRTAKLPEQPLDLLFVDGDHREIGVRADFERWAPLLGAGAHLLFHDAANASDLVSTASPGVARVVADVGDGFERRPAPGSLAHFVRRW